MDLPEIISWISALPTPILVIGGFILLILIFGEATIWDYEVKFPLKKGIGRGEVDFECGKKTGTRIECEFELDDSYKNIPIEIFLRNEKIFTIPAEKNMRKFIKIKKRISFERPEEGDLVTIKANQESIFTGQLVSD